MEGEIVRTVKWCGCLEKETIKCLEKEKAENDSQASESWLWEPGSRPQKGSCLLRSYARRTGPGPSPGAAKFQRLNPHPRKVC